MSRKKAMMIGLSVALVSFASDQLSKWYILYELGLPLHSSVELLPFFKLTMVWNYGISFGMLYKQDPMHAYLLSGMSVIIVAWIVGWMWRTQERYLVIAQGLIIGGALGNVVDRLRYGAVADFFDVFIGSYHWPAFNIADSCIFIGVAMLLFDSVFCKKSAKDNAKDAA